MKNIMTNTKIKEYLENKYKVNLTEQNRKPELNFFRGIFYMLCMKYSPNSTYENIGETVKRNHATVLNGVKKTSWRLESNLKVDDLFKGKYIKIHDDFYENHKESLIKSSFKDLHTKENIVLMKKIQHYKRKIKKLKSKISA